MFLPSKSAVARIYRAVALVLCAFCWCFSARSDQAVKRGDIISDTFDGNDVAVELAVSKTVGPNGDQTDLESFGVLQGQLRIFFKLDDPNATPPIQGATDAQISALLAANRLFPLGLDRRNGLVSVRAQGGPSAAQLTTLKNQIAASPLVRKVDYVSPIELLVPRYDTQGRAILDAKGNQVWDPVEELDSVGADVLNSAVQGGAVGLPIFPIPSDQIKNPFEAELTFSPTSAPTGERQGHITLTATYTNAVEDRDFIETGVNTGTFKTVSNFDEGFNELSLEFQQPLSLDPAKPDELGLILSSSTFNLDKSIVKKIVETGANTLDFKSIELVGSIRFSTPLNPAGADVVHVSIGKPGDTPIEADLTETGNDTRVFTRDGFTISLGSLSGFSSGVVDFGSAQITNPQLNVSGQFIDVVETSVNSLIFKTPDRSKLPIGSNPTPVLPKEAQFKLRIVDNSEPGPTFTLNVSGITDAGTEEQLGAVEFRRAANGAFETKPIFAVRNLPALTDTTKNILNDRAFLKGDGSLLKKAKAQKNVKKAGGGTIVAKVEKKANTRIFRGDDSIGFLQDLGWGHLDDAAKTFGWSDADTNRRATKDEILKHLGEMDGDDIWVYRGHCNFPGGRFDLPPQQLVGHTFFGDGDLISKDEMTQSLRRNRPSSSQVLWHRRQNPRFRDYFSISQAMAGKAPGLVVVGGCQSSAFAQTFVGSGAKVFAGFDKSLKYNLVVEATALFVRDLLTGKTVAQAKQETNVLLEKFDGTNLNKNGARLVVVTSDDSQTLYDILKVEKKEPKK